MSVVRRDDRRADVRRISHDDSDRQRRLAALGRVLLRYASADRRKEQESRCTTSETTRGAGDESPAPPTRA
ncbi:hypothetical protein [Roseiflexus sp.]